MDSNSAAHEPDDSGPWTNGDDPDPLLGVLVNLLEAGSFTGVPVTLNVGGKMMTGEMVSRATWFEAVLGVAKPGPAHEIISDLREQYIAAVPDEEDFLHLKDAMVLDGAWIRDKGAHWRCKLGAVGSWCWGSPELD